MKQEKKRRVFITGAGGFVGANITRRLLKENYDVHILSRTTTPSWRLKDIWNQITYYKGDITNFPSVKKAIQKTQPDYIIHLAAYGAYHYQTDMDKIINVNIEGTKNLLEASKEILYKCFIHTGSSSEYGFKNTAMKEDDSCNPVSYYAVTKLAATNLCKVFSHTNNKPIVTFRLFSIYGPYEEPTRFIPTIVKSLIKNEQIKLTPGNQRRDFIYVDDVCDVFVKAFDQGFKIKGEICNIGTGKEYTNDEVVKSLFTVTRKKTEIKKGEYPKRNWDTPHWKANTIHSQKLLGWKPKDTLDTGLKKTYSWVHDNLQIYK